MSWGISVKNLLEKIREIRKKLFKDKPGSKYTNLTPIDEIENGEEYICVELGA